MALVVSPRFASVRSRSQAALQERNPAEDVVFWFTKASWPFWSMTVFSVLLAFVLAP